MVVKNSRAEYFRDRRKQRKQFIVMIEREKIEAVDEKIKEKGLTRVDWFRQIIEKEFDIK